MTENVKTYVTEKTKELIAATSCSAEAKEAANAWLEAVGTEKEAEVTKNYIAELEEDIMPIDGLIAFAGSDMGAKVFGDAAKVYLLMQKRSKQQVRSIVTVRHVRHAKQFWQRKTRY